jgi:hypothetical protein
MRLYLLRYVFFIFSFIFSCVLLANTVDEKLSDLIKNFDYSIEFIKNDKTNDSNNKDTRLRRLGFDILSYESFKNNADASQVATDKTNKALSEIILDYYSHECNLSKSSTYCKAYDEKLTEYEAYYKSKYMVKAMIFPKIDLNNYTYTLEDGRIFNLKTKQYILPQSAVIKEAPVASIEAQPEEQQSVEKEASAKSNDLECSWVKSSPKKLLSGFNCNSKICTADVVCEKNGKKMGPRLATCSKDLCVEGKATECAKQQGYKSYAVSFSPKASSKKSENLKQKNGKSLN